MSSIQPRDFHVDQSFFGPMVLRQGKRVREHYATLVHWIEAAKLEATRQEEILLTPSIQIALRRSKENRIHIHGLAGASVTQEPANFGVFGLDQGAVCPVDRSNFIVGSLAFKPYPTWLIPEVWGHRLPGLT